MAMKWNEIEKNWIWNIERNEKDREKKKKELKEIVKTKDGKGAEKENFIFWPSEKGSLEWKKDWKGKEFFFVKNENK